MDKTISVLLRCHRDAILVARTVALVKKFTDEVIVFADERMSATELGAIAAAEPTRIVRIPHLEPNERSSAALRRHVSGDWIFRIDGDEIPSLELLRILRELVADNRMTHYHVRMAWLWPNAHSALDQKPWRHDTQARLHRNDPALLHYPGRTHGGIDLAGNFRYLRAPIFHLNLLQLSRQERAEKVARYDRENPGLLVGGEPLNSSYYLPEDGSNTPRHTEIPAEEAALIRDFLDRADAQEYPPLELEIVSESTIDADWDSRDWPGDAYRAQVTLADSVLEFPRAGVISIFIWIENRGSVTWASALATAALLRISYHWRRADGTLAVWEGLRTAFPGPIAPGERIIMPMQIASPGSGKWTLELDLVREGVRWFDATLPVLVTIE